MLVTRIDFPDGAPLLAGKTCRAELYGLYFNSGSAQLLSESDPMLRQIAGAVRASADASLTLEGHTDNTGTAQQNQQLSEQRADAVRKALATRFGVPGSRLSVRGFGMTRPIETNETVEGRARNRRVELVRPCGDRP